MNNNATGQSALFQPLSNLLIVIGIISAWCAYVVVAQNTDPTAYDIHEVNPRSKPLIFYILHGGGILSVLTGGIFSMLNGEYARTDRWTRFAFWILLISSIVWAFVAYGVKDFLTWKALGATGPLVWISCVLIFAGMGRTLWKVLEPVIRMIAYATAVLALISITTNYHYLTERWLSAPVQYMVLLMWFGGWTLLTSWNCTGLRLYLRRFPYLVFMLCAILTQTRSWFFMSIFLLMAIGYISIAMKADMTKYMEKFILNASVIIVLLSLAFFIFQEPLINAFNRFASRAFEDSRSELYGVFISQVPVTELILGKGPNATWSRGIGEAFEEYQYFDNAYLWMAFIGGLPLMGSYFILIVLPGIRALFKGTVGDDTAAAILVLLWGLACTGFSTFTNPSLTPFSYLICLMSGRCLGHLADVRNKTALMA
jgi:hypothetical protein